MKKIKLYAGNSEYILVLVFSREKAVKIQNCGQSAGKAFPKGEESSETNTLDTDYSVKIESELYGDI
ncbi:hypothetical protein HN418_00075 [archaeon]|nr:hypothetical protein [archaeon]